MTITLEEALERAVKGPLNSTEFDPLGGPECTTGTVNIESSKGVVAALDEGDQDPLVGLGSSIGSLKSKMIDNMLVTGALLSHCYNQLPDLVSRLEALQKWAEQMGGFNSPQWADLPELIERANKVQLP